MINCTRWQYFAAFKTEKKRKPCTCEAAYIVDQYKSYSNWRPTEDERVLFKNKEELRQHRLTLWPFRYDS